jgi:hypothetical protein
LELVLLLWLELVLLLWLELVLLLWLELVLLLWLELVLLLWLELVLLLWLELVLLGNGCGAAAGAGATARAGLTGGAERAPRICCGLGWAAPAIRGGSAASSAIPDLVARSSSERENRGLKAEPTAMPRAPSAPA